jgi:hypothetical protein
MRKQSVRNKGRGEECGRKSCLHFSKWESAQVIIIGRPRGWSGYSSCRRSGTTPNCTYFTAAIRSVDKTNRHQNHLLFLLLRDTHLPSSLVYLRLRERLEVES